MSKPIEKLHHSTAPEQVSTGSPENNLVRAVVCLILLLGALGWVYASSLQELVGIWWRDPQYSHGFLVPVFSVVFLWLRRNKVDLGTVSSSWFGAVVLGFGLILWAAGSFLYVEWIEHASLLVALSGVALVAGGWKLLKWSWPAIAFLIFMIPFPYRVEIALSDPLQKLATQSSCYLLQTLGRIAVAEGNVILLENGTIEVVQACNGLRMSVSFLAISVATAMLIQRRTWERVLVVLSAIPIALICNVVRITVTGFLSGWFSPHAGQLFFHDIAGWLMMPMALGFLALELWLIDFLLINPMAEGPVPVARESSQGIDLATRASPATSPERGT